MHEAFVEAWQPAAPSQTPSTPLVPSTHSLNIPTALAANTYFISSHFCHAPFFPTATNRPKLPPGTSYFPKACCSASSPTSASARIPDTQQLLPKHFALSPCFQILPFPETCCTASEAPFSANLSHLTPCYHSRLTPVPQTKFPTSPFIHFHYPDTNHPPILCILISGTSLPSSLGLSIHLSKISFRNAQQPWDEPPETQPTRPTLRSDFYPKLPLSFPKLESPS